MKVWLSSAALVAVVLGFALVASAEQGHAQAKIGQAAPEFALQDQNGKEVKLSDYAGKIVVLEWFNEECPFHQRHLKAKTFQTLADKYENKDVVWLAVNTTSGKTNADNKKAAEQFGLSYPILNDASGKVGHAYGAKTTPHMYIIDKDGTLAYMGGIDDDQRGNKGAEATNYVDKALAQLTAGESVSTPETKPYGCSVKYAD